METHRALARQVEEEWIAKYRAALDAAPVLQSRIVKLRAALDRAYNLFVSSLGTILNNLTRKQPLRPAAALAPAVKPIRAFPTPTRKGRQRSHKSGVSRERKAG